ncbi:MAG: cupin domain-containing protein [Verrucomicrobiae bacterium]|nr:cupin domain-containing protein [Verrucomicrobiae bacterium]
MNDKQTIIKHETDALRERSACGWRIRLISKEDVGAAAWTHVVDIDGAKPHYHKKSLEIYYVLEGEGEIILNEEKKKIFKGSIVQIPPGVIHGAIGKMRVLVIGIPDIDENDIFYVQ